MCGIVVVLSPRQPTAVATAVAMAGLLRHRGPDDEGYAVLDGERLLRLAGDDTPVAVMTTPTPSRPEGRAREHAARTSPLLMAHRRLSIVDLSPHGHQPMRRGDLHVVFNGEIYNHVELRAELEALGHTFDSHSDTEVLLAAYQQWGASAWSRFNGMWAIVIHDARRRMLVIARDRFGVKPLYVWSGADGSVLFSSETKALLAHPKVQAAADADACARFVAAGPQAWREQTLFAGIRRFPAGHWAELAVDTPAPLQPVPYWSLPPVDEVVLAAPFDARTADRLAEEYHALLDDAVRLRMRMDVRFGTALSGGLDSSQIASRVNAELRRRGTRERQEVFSSVYRGESLDANDTDRALAAALQRADESRYIAAMGERLAVRSNTIEPRWRDVPAAHEHMIWALDCPPANTLMSSWHTYALVAGRGVTVTLDGQGADEQLAGYLRYVRNVLVHAGTREALHSACALRRNALAGGRTVLAGLAGHVLRRLAGPAALEALSRRVAHAHDLAVTVPQALLKDFATDLQNLLQYADQSAMAWSIESRMPFMDWRLVQFLARVPTAYRIHDGWTKWLARHAMRNELPPGVVWRRDKIGWAIPEPAWFGSSGPLSAWLDETLRGSSLAHTMCAELGIEQRAAPLAVRLRLLNLAVWHRLFFEEPGRPGRRLGRTMALHGD